MGLGRAIGTAFMIARDLIARLLIMLGVTPNGITLAGLGFTIGAGVFLAMGAGDRLTGTGLWGEFLSRHNPADIGLSSWNLWAAGGIFCCAACDMLDGAVARIGNLHTTFGKFLDSTVDRLSDFALLGGIAFYYAWRGNVTFVLLAMVSFCNAFLISYTRAKAEAIIDRCPVGYWQRGERTAAILISILAFNVPALLYQQAIGPAFTAWARIRYTYLVTHDRVPAVDPRKGNWLNRLKLWRYPRMTLPYDLITGANILFLVFAPIPQVDVIRMWIAS